MMDMKQIDIVEKRANPPPKAKGFKKLFNALTGKDRYGLPAGAFNFYTGDTRGAAANEFATRDTMPVPGGFVTDNNEWHSMWRYLGREAPFDFSDGKGMYADFDIRHSKTCTMNVDVTIERDNNGYRIFNHITETPKEDRDLESVFWVVIYPANAARNRRVSDNVVRLPAPVVQLPDFKKAAIVGNNNDDTQKITTTRKRGKNQEK